MKGNIQLAFLLLLFSTHCTVQDNHIPDESSTGETLQLHPENPSYFLFRGEPTLLVTSAEHYGAVINLDFDYQRYLQTLASDGLNYTRIFTGMYCEKLNSFGIQKNSLAPAPGRLITPWARSEQPGYINGGNLFDLDQWNPQYFSRLKGFVAIAGELGIVVEVTLFTSLYNNWDYSPFYPSNNINITEDVGRERVHTLDNGPLWEYQEDLVRKLARELNAFDNVFFEIQNEPYADHPQTTIPINEFLPDWRNEWRNRVDLAKPESLSWQAKIASIVKDEEKSLAKKHLIAQNFCNFFYPLPEVNPNVSILNVHYAYPEAVRLNRGFRRVIGFDESGFAGGSDEVYRMQAWEFMLSGGGLFNHLDYSFYVGKEDGTGENNAPGGGSPQLRRQLKALKDFLEGFDFIHLSPENNPLRHSPGVRTRTLANSDCSEVAVYIRGNSPAILSFELAAGSYLVEWTHTQSGERSALGSRTHPGGLFSVESPVFDGDIALSLVRE